MLYCRWFCVLCPSLPFIEQVSFKRDAYAIVIANDGGDLGDLAVIYAYLFWTVCTFDPSFIVLYDKQILAVFAFDK